MMAARVEIVCAACCSDLDVVHAYLERADVLVAKALSLSEVARIARAEVRTREYLLKKWNVRVAEAAARAASAAANGGNLSAVVAVVDSSMGKWAEDVAKVWATELAEAYKLARIAGHKKASGRTTASLQYAVDLDAKIKKAAKNPTANLNPSFDLYDEAAVAALQRDQMLWIGKHYEKNVRTAVRETAGETLKKGLGRREAGQQMGAAIASRLEGISVPGGFRGTSQSYFEGLTANAFTVARTRGQIRSFVDLGVTRYELVNPMDSRTSRVCVHMNGKTFTVQHAASQIERVAGATNPDDVRKAHPWLSFAELQKLSPTAGAVGVKDSAALAAAGFALPPFHFRCRTTVDVSDDSVAYDALAGQQELPPIPARPPPTKKSVAAMAPVGAKIPSVPAKELPATLPPPSVETQMARAKVASAEPVGIGANGSMRATLEVDGREIKAIYKPAKGEVTHLSEGVPLHKREAAVYKIDKMMGGSGVVPETISAELSGAPKGVGSYQRWVDDAKMGREIIKSMDEKAFLKLVDVPASNRVAALDVISWNGDRHTQNIMYVLKDKKYRPVAIDNGFALPNRPGFEKGIPRQWQAAPGSTPATLDAATWEAVKQIDLKELDTVLRAAGIDETARKAALVRTKFIQDNGRLTYEAMEPKRAKHVAITQTSVNQTIEWSWKAPTQLIGEDDLKAIEAIVK